MTEDDFEQFNYIFAMDSDNLDALLESASENYHGKLRLLLEYAVSHPGNEVPDPYYGGDEGFRNVFTMVERTSQALLGSLKAHYGV